MVGHRSDAGGPGHVSGEAMVKVTIAAADGAVTAALTIDKVTNAAGSVLGELTPQTAADWTGMSVATTGATAGRFSSPGTPTDPVSGQFYGADASEVGGTFETVGGTLTGAGGLTVGSVNIIGAFGAIKK